jgi:hypothetical protein
MAQGRASLRYESQSSKTKTRRESLLEGRIAGPWVAELSRTWAELAPTLGTQKLSIDLRNTTYADASGIRVLRQIYSHTAVEFVTSTPWTQYLAEEVTRENAIQNDEEL